eukprot:4450918-Pyramimonas_sp.AAC.2
MTFTASDTDCDTQQRKRYRQSVDESAPLRMDTSSDNAWIASTSFVPMDDCKGIASSSEDEEDRYVHKNRCHPVVATIRAPVLTQLSKSLLNTSRGVMEWLNLGSQSPSAAEDRGRIASLEWLNLDHGGQRRNAARAALLY